MKGRQQVRVGVQGKKGGFAAPSSCCSSQQADQFPCFKGILYTQVTPHEGSQGCRSCPLSLGSARSAGSGARHTPVIPREHCVLAHNPAEKASQSDPFSPRAAPPPPFPSAAPKLLLLLHQLLIPSPRAALLSSLLPDAVKDSLNLEYWNFYWQELLCL